MAAMSSLKHESPHALRPFTASTDICAKTASRRAGKTLPAGTAFAEIGDFHENGNWFYHTHMQVPLRKRDWNGAIYPWGIALNPIWPR